jgi:hypothetical protein
MLSFSVVAEVRLATTEVVVDVPTGAIDYTENLLKKGICAFETKQIIGISVEDVIYTMVASDGKSRSFNLKGVLCVE